MLCLLAATLQNFDILMPSVLAFGLMMKGSMLCSDRQVFRQTCAQMVMCSDGYVLR